MTYPAQPTLASIAERLRDRTAPLAPDDPSFGYAHAYLCGSLGAIFREVAEVFDPDGDVPPLAPLLDPSLCPDWALPWLAQLVGIALPAGMADDAARETISSVAGFKRGTRQALEAAASLYLTGDKTVYFRERDGDPYVLEVVTLTSEVPPSDLGRPVNLVRNGSLESGVPPWTVSGNVVLTQASEGYVGSKSLRMARASTATACYAAADTSMLAAKSDTDYVAAAWVKPEDGIAPVLTMMVGSNKQNGTPNANLFPNVPAPPTGIWTRVVFPFRSPADTKELLIYAHWNAGGTSTSFLIDGVTLVEGTADPGYFDGDMLGYEWTGTPGLSQSKAITTSRVLGALLALKPGGIVLNYRTVAGWDYQAMTAAGGLYSALKTTYLTYRKLSDKTAG